MCRPSPFQSVSQVSGQNVDKLGIGRRLSQFSPGNQVQKAVVRIIPTALNKRAEIALDAAGRGLKMRRRLCIEALGNKNHILRLIPNLLHHVDRLAETRQFAAHTEKPQQAFGIQRGLRSVSFILRHIIN